MYNIKGLGDDEVKSVGVRGQYCEAVRGERVVGVVGVIPYRRMGRATQLGAGPHGPAPMFQYTMLQPAGGGSHIPGMTDRTFKKVNNIGT